MLERDPFGKAGEDSIADTPDRDRYSVEGDREREDVPVFGVRSELVMNEEEEQNRKKKARAWFIGGMAIAGVALITVIFFGISWYRANAFKNDRVVVSLEGSDTVSGENTERFVLVYENKNSVALQGAVVLFRFPDNFVPEEKNGLKRDGTTSARMEIGTIAPQQKGTLEVYGHFSGSAQSALYIRAILQYSPKNTSGSFQRETQKSMNVTASLVGVTLTLPIESAIGDLAEIAISATNRSKDTIFSGRLQMEYPEGFTFQGSDVRPSEGNSVWYLSPIEPGSTQTIKLYGRITGDRGTSKRFTAVVGVVRGDNSFSVYGKDERSIQLVGSPFSIRVATNAGDAKVVSAGTLVDFTLRYRNDGETGFRDAIVRTVLEGRIFDDTAIRVDGGSYDTNSRTVTWRASDIPALAFVEPKESGEVHFTLPIAKAIPMETVNDTRFTGSVMASIDSVDIPDRIGTRRIVSQDFAEFKLRSSPSIAVDLREAKTDINLPDVKFIVGKETELVAYARLRNTYNDVTGGQCTLSIPSGVVFAETIALQKDEVVSYNERSQKLVWEVGKLSAGTGALSPDRVMAFRIRVTPQEYQLSGSMALLGAMECSGKDDFTGEPITLSQGGLSAVRISGAPSM